MFKTCGLTLITFQKKELEIKENFTIQVCDGINRVGNQSFLKSFLNRF